MVFQQLNIPASNYSSAGKEHGMFENVVFFTMIFPQLNIPVSNYSTTGKEHGMFENVFFTIIFPQLKMLSSNCKSDSMQHKSISKKHEIYEKVLMSVIIFPLFKQGLLPCAAKYPTIVCLMVLKSLGYCQCMSS